jgi:hypothetical protein
LSLPGTEETPGRFAFSVLNRGKLKGFVWGWMERVEPKKPRVPNPSVVAIRVPNLNDKDLLIANEPAKYFTEPHYNGVPAVLVRLDAASVSDLRPLLEDAWRTQAPKELTGERASARKSAAPKAKETKRSAKRSK